MKIIDAYMLKWYMVNLKINWLAILLIMVLITIILSCINSKYFLFLGKSISVDKIKLGIGSNTITLKFDNKEQEVAFKLWVELCTRKIGLEFEKEYDVIQEVYNSWYEFFGVARSLMKEIPPREKGETLTSITEQVLNIGLRPHLTKWQAKYRKWYEDNNKKYDNLTPQEIQRNYPYYDELIEDLIKTNNKMLYYKDRLHEIAFYK